MIYEWSPPGAGRNLGDSLHSILLPRILSEEFEADLDHLICVIGSVVSRQVIEYALFQGLRPIFVSCGWDGSDLDGELLGHATFIGCRGPITQSELQKHGVFVEVSGDPGYALPEILEKGRSNGQSLLVPHAAEPDGTPSASAHGADLALSPICFTSEDILELTEIISGAEFVLAGSMHAAVIAHAYGVPFAPFRSIGSGFVDHPVKWVDWLASIGWGEPQFFSTVSDGREWFRDADQQARSGRSDRPSNSRYSNYVRQLRAVSKLLTTREHGGCLDPGHPAMPARSAYANQVTELTEARDFYANQVTELTEARDFYANQVTKLTEARD